jgi:hypothetical protein
LASACRRFDFTNRIRIDPDAIKKFGASLKGRLILPTDPAYEKAFRRNSNIKPNTG